ncbi:MAG: hypothetical protein HXY20_08810 [Acidobacteria bacterium]|nr:hypothetical protein [Acidobacteriota bacterium]
MIRRRTLVIAALAVICLAGALWSRTEFFLVENVKPGMKGFGKTVFQGSKPVDFDAEIIGVLRGVGPGTSAVLARLSGGALANTGVFEGMSGSPVYVEGKLLGAIAFSFQFAKEAIAGITPITQMVEAFADAGPPGSAGFRIMLKKSMLWDYLLPQNPPAEASEILARPHRDIQQEPVLARFGGHDMVPISTPLALGGFAPETLKAFGPQLRAMGLSALQGSGNPGPQPRAAPRKPAAADASPLEPGSAISIPLVRGDLDASAGGTVTHIEGDRLYAFGHQLFSLGFTELPIHRARTLTVFPSLQSSFTILETGDPIGATRQDRSSGIYGILGEKARMIPMTVQMTTSRGAKKVLKYEVARDQFLTPFLVNFTVFNSIVASERVLGVATLEIKGKISIKGQKAVEIENRFSSDSNSPAFASLSIALPVNFLLAFGYQNLEFERIDIEISAMEEDRAALLDSVRVDRSEIRAGDAVDMKIFSRKSNGESVEDHYPVRIPPDVTPGPIALLVADGTTIMERDAREQGDQLVPRDLPQLIEFINRLRKNDRLYVRLFRQEPGAVIRGEGLPGLPPSILSILRSERTTGGMSPIQTSTFMEFELPPSDYVVSGSKLLSLRIKP